MYNIIFTFHNIHLIFIKSICSQNCCKQTKFLRDNYKKSAIFLQVVPPWFNEQHNPGYSNSHEPEIIYTDPPKGHPSEYLYGAPPPTLQHVPHDWSSGPGLGSE